MFHQHVFVILEWGMLMSPLTYGSPCQRYRSMLHSAVAECCANHSNIDFDFNLGVTLPAAECCEKPQKADSNFHGYATPSRQYGTSGKGVKDRVRGSALDSP